MHIGGYGWLMAYNEVVGPEDEWLVELSDRRILWIIPLLAVVYLGWLVYLMSIAEAPVFPTRTWVLLGSAIFVVMIAFLALLLVKTRARPVVYPSQRFEEEQVDASLAGTEQGHRVATWPPEEEDEEGLYVSHHIQVGDDLVLKFRQELEEDWIGWD